MRTPQRARPLRSSVGLTALRGLAACGGAFVGVNLIVAQLDGGIDANLVWIDLRALPTWLGAVLEAVAAATLLGFAARPGGSARPGARAWPGRAQRLVFAALCLACLRDGAVVLGRHARGELPDWRLPFSFFVALGFAALWRASRATTEPAPQPPHRWLRAAGTLLGGAVLALAVPLGSVATFGRTDYRRVPPRARTSAAVVFGAGVAVDGTPSLALADRVRTAVDLYHGGNTQELWLSGGPGPGSVHETEAMRALAESLGVPAADLRCDRLGVSTWATAERTAGWARSTTGEEPRLFAVSHGYHLPRVELAFQRHGIDVLTVPAVETRPLARMPWYVLREVGGYWIYWARRAAFAALPTETESSSHP